MLKKILACSSHLKVKYFYIKLPIISILFETLELCCNYILSCYPYQVICVGLSPVLPLGMPTGEATRREFDCAYPIQPQGRAGLQGSTETPVWGGKAF